MLKGKEKFIDLSIINHHKTYHDLKKCGSQRI